MKRTSKCLSAILLGLVSPVLWANGCEELHINIINGTNSTCQLASQKILQGRLRSVPPALLFPGFVYQFDIKQTFHGPEIVLDYVCDNQHISFSSQQNYCFWEGGDIHGAVVTAEDNLRADYVSENGSYRWSSPGLINWRITRA